MTTRLLLSALLLLSLSGAAVAVEPGELACYDAAGGVEVQSIDSAVATSGGILVHLLAGTGLTLATGDCIASAGPKPMPLSGLDEVLIHCEDPAGEVVYHRPASRWAIRSGVLVWREVAPSADVYVSTLPCKVFNIGDEGDGKR